MVEKIVIRSEADAWAWIDRLTDGGHKFSGPINVKFDGWPELDLRYVGNDFHQSVPTRIMPPLLDAQREVNKLFCQMVYGSPDVRRMTKGDKSRLELVVNVKKGSSQLDTSLDQQLTNIVSEALSKMSPEQAMITILGAGLLFVSKVAWTTWVNHKTAEKAAEEDTKKAIELSKEETKRHAVLANAVARQPILKDVSKGVDEFRNQSLNKMEEADQFQLPGSNDLITGEEAAVITTSKREQSEEVRIDGEFLILSVDSGSVQGFKLKVKRVIDAAVIIVKIPDGVLSTNQRELLQKNEWAKKPVLLEINAKVLRGQITTATLIKASKIKKKKKKGQSTSTGN